MLSVGDRPKSSYTHTCAVNFDPSCEAMIYDETGLSLQGECLVELESLTGVGITGAFDYNRRVEYIIPQKEVRAGKCVRYIEVSANGVFGMLPQSYTRVRPHD